MEIASRMAFRAKGTTAPNPNVGAIIVKDGKILFGTWQGLYLFEHRLNAQVRKIVFHFIGN